MAKQYLINCNNKQKLNITGDMFMEICFKKYSGNNVALCRKTQHISQSELASSIGISTKKLRQIENFDIIPDLDVALRISQYFNISLFELFHFIN